MKNRYHHSFEKSAEYLRLAIQLMSQQKAALNPMSYAIWYEHVSGINKALSDRLTSLQNEGTKLDDNDVASIYYDYVIGASEKLIVRSADEFDRIAASVSSSAGNVMAKADNINGEIASLVDGQLDKERISKILALYQSMRSAIGDMQQQLDESRAEIDRLRNEVQRAREEAWIDALTGLPNRRRLMQVLEEQVECATTGTQRWFSIIVVDIDHFKKINDTYGHLFGDKVIRTVAKILKDNIKGQDFVARYGGEEFVIVLPQTLTAHAAAVAENLRKKVEAARVKRVTNNDIVGNITVSAGVGGWSAGESANDLFARADSALYDAKRGGRNRVVIAEQPRTSLASRQHAQPSLLAV